MDALLARIILISGLSMLLVLLSHEGVVVWLVIVGGALSLVVPWNIGPRIGPKRGRRRARKARK